jgi:hypothetical protein
VMSSSSARAFVKMSSICLTLSRRIVSSMIQTAWG